MTNADEMAKLAQHAVDILDNASKKGWVPPGVILPYALPVAPHGWMLCLGQVLTEGGPPGPGNPQRLRQALIDAGYPYGQDGSDPKLPDTARKVLGGLDPDYDDDGAVDWATVGAEGGAETHTLTESEMPLHGHPFRVNAGSSSATESSGGIALDGNNPVTRDAYTGAPSNNNAQVIGGSGGGEAHNNLQPTLVVPCIIKL